LKLENQNITMELVQGLLNDKIELTQKILSLEQLAKTKRKLFQKEKEKHNSRISVLKNSICILSII
jgi:hypothetical protein